MRWPGRRRPSFSAVSIIARAMRSLTEPNGFWLSSFARSRTPGFGESTLTSTSGVSPIWSRTLVRGVTGVRISDQKGRISSPAADAAGAAREPLLFWLERWVPLLDGSRTLDEFLAGVTLDQEREEEKDAVWVAVQESLGDSHWTPRNQRNWGAAWQYYSQVLEWWAGQRATPEARREVLMPFFWSTIAKEGQLYGNQHKGSIGHVTNGKNFSYPGYSEILCGFSDPRIDSNAKKPNPNVTMPEWLNGKPAFAGRVAASHGRRGK